MTGHDPERAYVAAMLDHEQDKLDQATAAMRADVDRLRESWSSGYAQQLADHQDRMAQMRADQAAWLTRFINGEADEPAPTQDVAQGQAGASTAGRNAPASSGPGPGQPNNPHAAMLAEADRLRQLPMAPYAQERERLIRSRTSRGMFG